MAGLVHDTFCRHKANCTDPAPSFRGECGNCLGRCQPCADDGSNCGEWQECDCALGNSCGDGHNCKRYIDIEFTLDEFPIQGAYCCQNSPPLAQPCGGGITDPSGNPLMVPVSANPSGWSDFTGLQPKVMYPATTHKIRLTRTACGCFWGGFWSSSCDMLRCCEDASDGHHICGSGSCVEPLVCEDCDPDDDPCANIDDGWASSLDDWGDGGGIESGGAAGALCIGDGCPSSTPCDYTGGSCTEPQLYAERGCKKVGNFKPFHIEAFMQHNVDVSSCNGEWQLEIRGQTIDIRQHASGMGTSAICDFCTGGGCNSPPSPNPFATGNQWALFRGRWQGWDNSCGGYWGTDPCTEIYHDQCHLDEFAHVGCACPQEMEFESTVLVDNNFRQLHPTFKVFDNCNWEECMAPHDNCLPTGGDCEGDRCWGTPTTWCGECDYCDGCDGDWTIDTNCHGTLGCDHSLCLCDCCGDPTSPTDDLWCKCTPPSGTDWDNYDYLFPCSNSRCVDGDADSLESECEPCNAENQSRMCADVTVKMTPNNNPKPYWVE
jgi:hypothetical protein